jgi:hypothetical protein
MKNTNIILTFLLAGIFIFFFIPAKAQTNETGTAYNELIIGVPKISDKTLEIITEAIKSIEGTEYIMFCPEQKLILIKYNNSIFPNKEDVIKAIENKNISLPMFIKEGTFDGVKELCGNN